LTREAKEKLLKGCQIPEILVFVPTFNSEKYLRQCLDSVLNQTFEDWQCVISDDASTDSSVEIAREYERRDPRFKVLTHSSNVGAANNWNRAKENNTSFATKILCADDYLLPEALSTQIVILKENNSSIVFSERLILLPDGKKLFGEPVAALFRTEYFKSSEGFMPQFEYTLDTSGYMAISRKREVTFDNNVVGVFRVSKTQWSHQLKTKQFSHIFEFIDHLVEVEGVRVSKIQVLVGKIKVMGANLVRVFIYKFLREK